MAIAPSETYTQTKQEFLNSVLNKIGKQEFSNQAYVNPLKRFKGGFVDGPTDIEEIYISRVADTGYDKEGKGVLDRVKPNLKVQYHTNTKEHGYKTTIQKKEMRKGFLTKNGLSTMADNIILSLHNGAELDEYQDIINVIKAITDEAITTKRTIEVAPVTDEKTSIELCKAIKKVIPKMSEWNSVYSEVENFAKPSNLVLFLDSDTDVEVNVSYLASLFNMDVAKLNDTTKIVVPNFKTKMGNNVIGLLVDERCIKVNPSYYDIGSKENTRGKFINYDLVTETLLSYTSWFQHVAIVEKTVTP